MYERPFGVSLISILHWIGGIAALVLALLLIIAAISLPQTGIPIELLFMLLLGAGALGVSVGYGLWKMRYWARIIAILIAAANIVFVYIQFISTDRFDRFTSGEILIGLLRMMAESMIFIYLIMIKQAFLDAE